MSNLTDALIAAKLVGGGGSGGGGMFVIEVEETSSGGFPPQITHTVLTPYADIYNACRSLQPALLKFLPSFGNGSEFALLSPNVYDDEMLYEGGLCMVEEVGIHAWSYYITLDLSQQTVSFDLTDTIISPSA